MLPLESKHFYVRLRTPSDLVAKYVTLLRNRFEKVAGYGVGTEEALQDWWIEVRHPCEDAGSFLGLLIASGVEKEIIRECREVAPLSGEIMARQRPLFPA